MATTGGPSKLGRILGSTLVGAFLGLIALLVAKRLLPSLLLATVASAAVVAGAVFLCTWAEVKSQGGRSPGGLLAMLGGCAAGAVAGLLWLTEVGPGLLLHLVPGATAAAVTSYLMADERPPG
jgi:hypothetical protein